MMNFDKIYIYIDFTKYFNYASKHVINQKQVLVVYCRMQLKNKKNTFMSVALPLQSP